MSEGIEAPCNKANRRSSDCSLSPQSKAVECMVCGNESPDGLQSIAHHQFCSLREPEFSVGDKVTFCPYGVGTPAIVNGVLAKAGEPVRYSLHGQRKPLKTLATGQNIVESMLYIDNHQSRE